MRGNSIFFSRLPLSMNTVRQRVTISENSDQASMPDKQIDRIGEPAAGHAGQLWRP